MTQNVAPDCLVLKLEEIEKASGLLDTSVFIFYDQKEEKYVIRGRRRNMPNNEACTYSYDCVSIHDMVEFLSYIISKKYRTNEILYNYDNLHDNSNEVTFEFLLEQENKDYEISGYDNNKPTEKRFYKLLRMLKKVGNKY